MKLVSRNFDKEESKCGHRVSRKELTTYAKGMFSHKRGLCFLSELGSGGQRHFVGYFRLQRCFGSIFLPQFFYGASKLRVD